jgi:hypothetical protein
LKDHEDDQDNHYLGQSLPNTSAIPKCPECNSDRVAGIFYGSTPSIGSGSKYHPGQLPDGRLAELIEQQDVILASSAGGEIWRMKPCPMWHCHNCSHNFG